jgi:hypothetical protein
MFVSAHLGGVGRVRCYSLSSRADPLRINIDSRLRSAQTCLCNAGQTNMTSTGGKMKFCAFRSKYSQMGKLYSHASLNDENTF